MEQEFCRPSELNFKNKLHEECGIFGVYSFNSNSKISELCHLGLLALQHRGQESAGMAVSNYNEIKSYKAQGLVNEVFGGEELSKLKLKEAHMVLGHVRYSTGGEDIPENIQPLNVNSSKGKMSLAHNGHLLNALSLRTELENEGSIFHTSVDTEVLAHLLARAEAADIPTAFKEIHSKLKGAYSIIILEGERLIGLRDPKGFRPLVIGKLDDSYIMASETCAFNTLGAEFIREVEPGEMIIIDNDGLKSEFYSNNQHTEQKSLCIFEFIYFARPDSYISGRNVHQVRREIGRMLARDSIVKADIVVPVPDSGVSAALGFAEESGLPYQRGLIRNSYSGRTFILPTQKMRELKVRVKLNPVKEVVSGLRLAVIDDSIVRGTTINSLIKILYKSGAKKIDVYSASPQIVYPCYYGIDTPEQSELIAGDSTVEEIRDMIGADSLTYLSLLGLISAVGIEKDQVCTACFDGDYPIKPGS